MDTTELEITQYIVIF